MYLQNKELYIDNDFLYVQCPSCSTTMKNTINGVARNSLRCNYCNESYKIIVNRREHYRKSIMTQSRCFSAKSGAFDAIVVNISKGGLKLATGSDSYQFNIEDCVRIKFSIGSQIVEVLVQISNICGTNSYGCIFLSEYSEKDSIEMIESYLTGE